MLTKFGIQAAFFCIFVEEVYLQQTFVAVEYVMSFLCCINL